MGKGAVIGNGPGFPKGFASDLRNSDQAPGYYTFAREAGIWNRGIRKKN